MYFIEKILKLFYNKTSYKQPYTPQEIENCTHIFMPIDSSGEYLACTKCGKVIKRKD